MKDTDCKGERICEQHQCVDPSANVPASYAPVAPAPVPPPRPMTPAANPQSTAHRHLGGFFRPDLGFGYASMAASQNGTDAKISGTAGTLGVAVGGAISENTILAFHIWDAAVSNPTVTVGGTTVNNANVTMALFALGPELSVYSRSNLYFAITPSLTRGTLESNGTSSDTSWGFGVRGAVGKEWWVSDHWGLGLAGHLSFSENKDSGGSNPPTWTGFAATVAFSATYN